MTAALKPVPPPDDPDAPRLALVAAGLIERVGEDLVRAHLPQTRVRAPRPGHAVMACRCGAVLDLTDMRRAAPRQGDTRPIAPIVCPVCASGRGW